jgi:hypothetical protein
LCVRTRDFVATEQMQWGFADVLAATWAEVGKVHHESQTRIVTVPLLLFWGALNAKPTDSLRPGLVVISACEQSHLTV